MSKFKKTHADCMSTICGVCTRKFPASELRGIAEADLVLIQRHIYASYDLSVMPNKACKSCKKAIAVIEKDGPSGGRRKPNVDNHHNQAASRRLPLLLLQHWEDERPGVCQTLRGCRGQCRKTSSGRCPTSSCPENLQFLQR